MEGVLDSGPMSATAWREKTSAHSLRHLLAIFVGLGIFLRLLRYALGLPVWGDEAFLGINILDRSYLGFLKPLEYIQVAPLGFLWIERAMFQLFGPSEYVMRLVPTTVGVAGLIVFALWTRKILNPLPATLAMAVWAVSDLGIRHAVELKPYSIDFLSAVVLLYFATSFWIDRRNRWLIALIAVSPVAMFVSLPAILVAAGIAVVFLASIRRMTGRQRGLLIAYAASLLGSFALLDWGYLRVQFAGSAKLQQMLWNFPPLDPGAFVKWFIWAHSGNCFNYPIDASQPAGAVGFWLMIIGAIALVRQGRKMIAALLLSPLVMTFFAALLRRYPYADSARLAQHMAGSICVLIGVGAAAIIEQTTRTQRAARLLATGWLTAFFLIGVATAISFAMPPTTEVRRDQMKRSFVLGLLQRAPPNATVIVLNTNYQVAAITRWYIDTWPHRIVWGVDVRDLGKYAAGPIVIFNAANKLPGLDDQVISELGPPTEYRVNGFGPGEGECEAFVYSDLRPRLVRVGS